MNEVFIVSLLGLATTSAAMAGTAIGLYCPLSKRAPIKVVALSNTPLYDVSHLSITLPSSALVPGSGVRRPG